MSLLALLASRAESVTPAPPAPPEFTFDAARYSGPATAEPPSLVAAQVGWDAASSLVPARTRHAWDSGIWRIQGMNPLVSSVSSAEAPTVAAQQLSTAEPPAYVVEVDLDGTDAALCHVPTTAKAAARIYVDGAPVASGNVGLGTLTVGQPSALRFTWGTAKKRRVRVELRDTALWCLDTAQGTVASATEPRGPSLAVYGDSYIEGHVSDGDARLDALALVMSRLLDAEVFQCGHGGTGYVAGAKPYGSPERMAELEAMRPGAVVIFGTQNDDGANPMGVQLNARDVYTRLALNLPDAPVLVVGPGSFNDATNALQDNDNAVADAADAASNVIAYVSPRDERWVTGTGSIYDANATGTAKVYTTLNHISKAGNRMYAEKIGARLAELLPAA